VHSAAVVIHGGGPTQVINASLAAVVAETARHAGITKLYGARNGIRGLLAGDLVDLRQYDEAFWARVAHTPGSLLGSCRTHVTDDEPVLTALAGHDIRTVFLTGGNGSMSTALGLSRYGHLRVIGIPKTIDNDLAGTDYAPGYGSAARFFACAARDVGADIRALSQRVSVLEVMGRNVGWLAAATCLARHREEDPPQLIYLPERRLSVERLCRDVEQVYSRLGYALVIVCEGQLDERGQPFGADVMDQEGPTRQLARNLGHVLAETLKRNLGLHARSEKPGLLGRSSAFTISEADRQASYQCGVAAVQAAVEGSTGVMVALRDGGVGVVPLTEVAGRERAVPGDWITADGRDIHPDFRGYALPMTGAIDPHPRL
jgi:ATP-dependent phosphofructokinase / diphosphate-dependent phosphofructokinase